MFVSIRSLRKSALLTAIALVMAGCGGDDEDKSATGPTSDGPIIVETSGSETKTLEVNPETETLPNDGDGTGTGGGEDQQGGAGDETPAETLALFTAGDGSITPRVVRVPAFISIRVELRSGDGGSYSLTFGDKKIQVPGELSSASTSFAGLRPGEKLVGTPTGASGKVTIEATAEPGP
jgi:hypothetical protein